MKKFWNWKVKAATETAPEERTLFLNGTIAEDSWYDDDVTPQLFKDELMGGSGNITVWINSPGGGRSPARWLHAVFPGGGGQFPHGEDRSEMQN